MAFLNKVSAEDLKNAGFDPQEIKDSLKAVKDGSATKEDLDKVSQALTAIQTSQEGFQAQIAATLEEIKNKGIKKEDPPLENKDGEIDPLDFMSDPAASVKKTMQKDMNTLQLQNVKLYSDMAYDNARRDTDKFPLFGRFRAEIDEKWNKYPLAYKTTPIELIENIYKIVVASHLEELTTEAAKNNGRYNLGSSGANGGGNVNRRDETPKPASEQLTEAEKKVAKNMGLTDEEYLKEKEAIHFV